MQRFNVDVDGGHKASISIDLTGDTFTGHVETAEYGQGDITGGKVEGTKLTGVVSLKGYDADFSANLIGQVITGNIKYGWFFNKSFTGVVSV